MLFKNNLVASEEKKLKEYVKLFAQWLLYKLIVYTTVAGGIFWLILSLVLLFFPDITNASEDDMFNWCLILGFLGALLVWIGEYAEIKNKRLAEHEKARLKKEADDAAAAKKEEAKLTKITREKDNLANSKDELKKLSDEINNSTEDSLIVWTKEYSSIVATVEQEQGQLQDLNQRHPTIGKFLETRGQDDLNTKVFKELKKHLKAKL